MGNENSASTTSMPAMVSQCMGVSDRCTVSRHMPPKARAEFGSTRGAAKTRLEDVGELIRLWGEDSLLRPMLRRNGTPTLSPACPRGLHQHCTRVARAVWAGMMARAADH